MRRSIFRSIVLAAAMLASAASLAAAARYNVDMTAQAKVSTSGMTVKLSGAPIGNCSGNVTLTANGAIFKAKCKGGRLNVRITFNDHDQSRGTWKFVSGTGKFEGSKGSGKYSGSLESLRFHMTGAARY